MPNNKHTPSPVGGPGVLEDGGDTSINHTAYLQMRHLEESLLRGLLVYPAARVLQISDGLEPDDFPDDAHRRVMHAVVDCARSLVEAGEGEKVVSAAVVLALLQDRGDLPHGTTPHVLIEVSTGTPPAWHEVQQLAAALRMGRLRRAVTDHGHALLAAAVDSSLELACVLQQLIHLLQLARRAGLEVTCA